MTAQADTHDKEAQIGMELLETVYLEIGDMAEKSVTKICERHNIQPTAHMQFVILDALMARGGVMLALLTMLALKNAESAGQDREEVLQHMTSMLLDAQKTYVAHFISTLKEQGVEVGNRDALVEESMKQFREFECKK